MFPGAGAQVYYNEAGEPTGWDYPDQDGPDDADDPDLDGGGYDDDDDDECGECGGPLASDDVCADDTCGEDEDEPQEPDDTETSWQEYGRDEAYADAEMARYDDDPNPYEGTYSEQ